MAGDTVQQVKDKLSIADVVSQYVKLERAGGSLRARCPFHAERTPSFFVSPERGTYHCFGCNTGGDIFSFVEQIEGLDFKGALKVLAERAGVPLVYERPEKKDARDRLFELLETAAIFYASRLNDAAKKYLTERGLSETTMQAFRIGLAGDAWTELSDYLKAKSAGGGSSSGGKFSDNEIIEAGLGKKSERGGVTDKFRNRIMFPIADSAGRIIGFSGRIFPIKPAATGEAASHDGGFEPPKYMNSPETPLFHKSRILYGFDRAKTAMRKHNFAILVEGQMDLIASHQAGWANTVAVSGTAFTPEHAGLVKRMTENLVLALDADEAGIKAAGRAARAALLSGLNVKVARLPTGKDPADLILEDAEAWRAAIRESKDIITFLLDVLEEHAKNPDNLRRSVELVVLPFLSDVQSPIAREQYIQEIAARLHVSEKAVAEAFAKTPRAGAPAQAGAPARSAHDDAHDPVRVADRVRQAYAILVWQESVQKPLINTKNYEKGLAESIGADTLAVLRALPATEQESLRFSAERLHGDASHLDKDTMELLNILLVERLRGELSRTSREIQQAEEEGRDADLERLMQESKLLTARIAQLHEVR